MKYILLSQNNIVAITDSPVEIMKCYNDLWRQNRNDLKLFTDDHLVVEPIPIEVEVDGKKFKSIEEARLYVFTCLVGKRWFFDSKDKIVQCTPNGASTDKYIRIDVTSWGLPKS